MKIFLCSLLFVVTMTSPVFGDVEYAIQDLGTISSCESATCVDLNDTGQALLKCQIDSTEYLAIWDHSLELVALSNINKPDNVQFEKITDSGQLVGTMPRQTNGRQKIVVWDGFQTVQTWNLGAMKVSNVAFTKGHCSDFVVATQINGGTSRNDKNRVVIFKEGKFYNFNIDTQLRRLGYNDSSLTAIAINEHGHILGSFTHWKKQPYKKKYYIQGPEYFVWDGASLHLINKPSYVKDMQASDINNHGDVLVTTVANKNGIPRVNGKKVLQATGIWNQENGFSWFLQEKISDQAELTDSRDFIVKDSGLLYLCHGSQYEKIEINTMHAPYGNGNISALQNVNLAALNRNGWLVVMAKFFNEEHPVLMMPVIPTDA